MEKIDFNEYPDLSLTNIRIYNDKFDNWIYYKWRKTIKNRKEIILKWEYINQKDFNIDKVDYDWEYYTNYSFVPNVKQLIWLFDGWIILEKYWNMKYYLQYKKINWKYIVELVWDALILTTNENEYLANALILLIDTLYYKWTYPDIINSFNKKHIKKKTKISDFIKNKIYKIFIKKCRYSYFNKYIEYNFNKKIFWYIIDFKLSIEKESDVLQKLLNKS